MSGACSSVTKCSARLRVGSGRRLMTSSIMGEAFAANRSRRLEELEREFEVLVVGGGITGCGIAREAVLRGLTVALVEQQDFAGGTSSRSSGLIHGGGSEERRGGEEGRS